MKPHGGPIGLFRSDNPEKDVQRIKDGGLEVRQKGDAPEHVRVPQGNGAVLMNLIEKELLEPEIKGYEVGPCEQMAAENDIPEEVQAQEDDHETNHDIFSQGALIHPESSFSGRPGSGVSGTQAGRPKGQAPANDREGTMFG